MGNPSGVLVCWGIVFWKDYLKVMVSHKITGRSWMYKIVTKQIGQLVVPVGNQNCEVVSKCFGQFLMLFFINKYNCLCSDFKVVAFLMQVIVAQATVP